MRESDIRPAEILKEYLRLSALDAETMFADCSQFGQRPCPGCGGVELCPAFSKHGFDLVRCAGCDTLFVSPCPTDDQLLPLYADSPSTRYWAEVFFPAVAEARRTRIFAPRVERLLSMMADQKQALETIVEVGAGAGIFLEEVRHTRPNISLRAVEPGSALARQCRESGFETFKGTAETASRDPDWMGTADLVVCFEVIEHTVDAFSFTSSLRRLAKPGAIVLFTGLSGDGFDIRTLQERSNAVAPPHHLTFLSRQGVARLMQRAGLEAVEVFTPGELDVDIVVNALNEDQSAVLDPFLKNLMLGPNEAARTAFQSFLRENGLSSHMWALGRRTVGDAGLEAS